MLWPFRPSKEKHCHGPSTDPSASRQHRQLTAEQQNLLRDLLCKDLMQPREARTLLAQHNPFITRRDIYNEKSRMKREQRNGRTPTQRLFAILQDQELPHFVEWCSNEAERSSPQYILWSTHRCIEQWNRFLEVLGWHCTYKTNPFGMPFLQITVTRFRSSSACWAFLKTEKSQDKDRGYNLIVPTVDTLTKAHGISQPQVCLTDYDMALKNALSKTWPSVQQQMCLFHINKNVLWNCLSRAMVTW